MQHCCMIYSLICKIIKELKTEIRKVLSLIQIMYITVY